MLSKKKAFSKFQKDMKCGSKSRQNYCKISVKEIIFNTVVDHDIAS